MEAQGRWRRRRRSRRRLFFRWVPVGRWQSLRRLQLRLWFFRIKLIKRRFIRWFKKWRQQQWWFQVQTPVFFFSFFVNWTVEVAVLGQR